MRKTCCVLYVLLALGLTVLPVPVNALNILVDSSGTYHDAPVPDWLRSLGHQVTVISDYKGEDLSTYDAVMDFGYNQWVGLNTTKINGYTQYLQNGGGLYLSGDKPVSLGLPQTEHVIQDQKIIAFVESLGGGTIEALWTDNLGMFLNEQIVPSPVTNNASLSYLLDFGLGVTNPGNGFFIVETTTRRIGYDGPNVYENGHWSNLIGFDFNDLTLAPVSRLVIDFDVTGMDFSDPMFVNNKYLLSEIVNFLGTRPPQRTLAVTTAGTGSGTVNSNPTGIACESGIGNGCNASFFSGTPITLTAAPDAKSDFTGWTVGCNGTAITCNFSINGDTGVTATFNHKPLVMLPGPTYYATIQDGYNVSNGGILRLRDQTFDENLVFNRTVDVSLDGGYDATWNRTGSTSLNGSMTIRAGRVTPHSLFIK